MISLHCQRVPGWMSQYLLETGNNWLKIVDPPEGNSLFPGINIAGRMFMPDEVTNALIWRGAAGAEEWFNTWVNSFQRRPYIRVWCLPNEPQPAGNIAFLKCLSDFTGRANTLMHQIGKETMGYNFSVGWPRVPTENEPGIEDVRYLAEGLENMDYLGLHEYAWPELWHGDGWWTLRYRKTVEQLKRFNLRVPPILIGELGLDAAVIPGQSHRGWTEICNEEQYVDQLRWYGHELAKDGLVKAAFVFTAGWYPPWQSFNVSESLAMKMPHRSEFPQVTPPPPTPPTPTPPPEEGTMKLRYPLHREYRISCDFRCHKNRTPPSTVPGIDIAAPTGIPIYAIAPGYIEVAEGKGLGGIRCWINHGKDELGRVVKSYYAHMDSLCVMKGQTLTHCDQIGTVGSTGNSTGPHLHLYIRIGGNPVDPEKVLEMP